MTQAQRDIRRKLRVLEHAEQTSNVSKTCRYFGISRDTFYRWKKNYQERGEGGLVNSKPCPKNLSLRTPPEIEEKIIYLRKKYHLGQLRTLEHPPHLKTRPAHCLKESQLHDLRSSL